MSDKRFRLKNSKWLAPTLCLVICLVAFGLRILPGSRTIDDAYITFRYARNLLSGAGFVFNPGERVLGTTTPLYSLILTLSALPFGADKAAFPQLAQVINALADALTCWLLFQLGRTFGSLRVAVGVALVWAVAPFSVTFAIGGLETSVYILTMLAAVYFYVTGNQVLAAASCALALLTRPDALILIIPLAMDRLWVLLSAGRLLRQAEESSFSVILNLVKQHRLEFLAFILPITAWLCFSTIYFGSPIPQSIAAKSVAYRVEAGSALIRLLQHYLTPFMEHLTFGTRWIAFSFVLYPFLFLAGALSAVKINPRIWIFAAYPWFYLGVYAWANPLIFRWYLTPPLPALFLFILIGLEQVTLKAFSFLTSRLTRQPESAQGQARRQALSGALCIFLVVIMPVAFSLQDWKMVPDHGNRQPAPEMAWYRLELLYRHAADFLRPRLDAGGELEKTIAAGDVGVLGYYSGVSILDTVGLNSPVSSRYYPLDSRFYAINYAIPPQLILDERPDYLVILEVYGRAGLLTDPRITERYAIIQVFPTEIYGSQGLLVMERK